MYCINKSSYKIDINFLLEYNKRGAIYCVREVQICYMLLKEMDERLSLIQ